MHHRYDKNHVPIELLRTLVAISQAGSFTRAGLALGLSQSAISAQIKRLDQLVGGNVFEKSGGGLTLSARGKTVERYAHRILDINDQLLSLSGAQSTKQLVRIGVMSSFAAALTVKIHQSCEAADTDAQIQLQSDASHNLLPALGDGHLDVAVALDIGAHGFSPIAEWDEQLVWACKPDLVVSPNAPIPYISWPNSPTDRIAINALEAASRRYHVAFAGKDYSARFAAAHAGLGYMLMPGSALASGLKIAHESFLPKLPTMRAGICVSGDFDSAGHRRLLNAIVSAVGSVVPLRMADQKQAARSARPRPPRLRLLAQAALPGSATPPANRTRRPRSW
ncbi:MAG: LysR family transcriptional regulator [Alphaproteobacteria bacterium]|nr:LysR family transcriptional regulator [Alphaproteobacteria bacterium]